jgi:hypothetical protein
MAINSTINVNYGTDPPTLTVTVVPVAGKDPTTVTIVVINSTTHRTVTATGPSYSQTVIVGQSYTIVVTLGGETNTTTLTP